MSGILTKLRKWGRKQAIAGRLRELATTSERFYQQGNYRQCIAYNTIASGLIADRLGRDTVEYAFSLQSLADLHSLIGDHAKAARLNQEALAIFRKHLPVGHDSIVYALQQLTDAYQEMGRYGAALTPLKELTAMLKQTRGTRDPAYVLVLISLAQVHRILRNGREAVASFTEAADLTRSLRGPTSRDYAASLNNLGFGHLANYDYQAARQCFTESVEIFRRVMGEDNPEIATVFSNLGLLYDLIDDADGAEHAHARALEILKTHKEDRLSDYLRVLNNVAANHHHNHRESAAEQLHLEVLGSLDKIPTSERDHEWAYHKAATLHNLSGVYRAKGNFEQAEMKAREALALIAECMGKDNEDYERSLHNLGLILSQQGKNAEAEQVLREALERRSCALGDRASGSGSESVLAALLVRTGRVTEAIELMERDASRDDQKMWQVLSAGSEQQRMNHLDRLRKNTFGFLSLVLRQGQASPKLTERACDMVLRRKAISLEVLALQWRSALASENPNLLQKMEELQSLKSQLANQELSPQLQDQDEQIKTIDEQLRDNIEQLESELASQIPELHLERKSRKVSCQALLQILPNDSALIEFVRFEPFDFSRLPEREGSQWDPARYLAFVLRADAPEKVRLIDLGEASSIERHIATWRDAIVGRSKARDTPFDSVTMTAATEASPYNPLAGIVQAARDLSALVPPDEPRRALEAGRALRQAVFDSLKVVLGKCQRLFLAPDGDLSRVPFESLPLSEDRYLLDEYNISYVGVGRDILRFGATHSGQSTPALVVADPDFDLGQESLRETHTQGPFRQLDGMRAEGESIANLLQTTPILGKNAVEGTVSQVRSPLILHLATHGYFVAGCSHDRIDKKGEIRSDVANDDGIVGILSRVKNPMLRSGLALAGVNTFFRRGSLPPEAEDGMLTAEDVTNMNLLATELVVLSACDTGLGEIHHGEGVLGLRRAFVLAGAKTLVMSLWKVPDTETRELMDDFYRRILKGQSRSEALRLAQLAMKTKHPDPFYWGAFICQGEPGPLDRQQE